VYDAHMSDVAEDDCAVCGRWPPAFNPTMRDAIFHIPLKPTVTIALWRSGIMFGSDPRLDVGSPKARVARGRMKQPVLFVLAPVINF
jgi:hypothetical protein